MIEEEEAIQRCKSGDREAFRYLVERYQNVLYGTAYLMTGDRTVAEDQVQEAFFSAWKNIGGFKSGLPLKPWLVRILVNKVLSYRRSMSQSKSLAFHEHDNGQESATQKIDDPVDEVERHDQVRRALDKLNEEHRQVILLRYFTGLSLAETSSALKRPEGTIKSQLHRAMEHMQSALNDGKI
jgi:RNA polymerase sigma-70 factor, ECF subfamily